MISSVCSSCNLNAALYLTLTTFSKIPPLADYDPNVES